MPPVRICQPERTPIVGRCPRTFARELFPAVTAAIGFDRALTRIRLLSASVFSIGSSSSKLSARIALFSRRRSSTSSSNAAASIVIPLKAIVLNLHSVGASCGVLVLVFQDGRLESLLGFHR